MKNVKTFNEFINENYELKHSEITLDNIDELLPKIKTLILSFGNENIIKGLEFYKDNKEDYSNDDMVKTFIDKFIHDTNEIIKNKKPNFFNQFDMGYSGNKFTGSEYERTKDMSTKDLSKMIKQELSITFDGCKFSVVSDYNSIRININNITFNPFSEFYQKHLNEGLTINEIYELGKDKEFRYHDQPKYNEKYIEFRKKIESMVNKYNYDDSNSQVDYFSTNFYKNIHLDDDKMVIKFYPEGGESKKIKDREDYYKQKDVTNKIIRDSRKGKLKKGDLIIYTKIQGSSNVSAGKYEGKILKAPNGTSMFSYYVIEFYVPKNDKTVTYTNKGIRENDIKLKDTEIS